MKQHVKVFSDIYQKFIDDQINDYLAEHPNYIIDKISWVGEDYNAYDRVLVVFNVG